MFKSSVHTFEVPPLAAYITTSNKEPYDIRLGSSYIVECSWQKKWRDARRNDMKHTSPVSMTFLSLKVGRVIMSPILVETYSAVTLFLVEKTNF